MAQSHHRAWLGPSQDLGNPVPADGGGFYLTDQIVIPVCGKTH